MVFVESRLQQRSGLLGTIISFVEVHWYTWYKVLYQHTMYVMGMYLIFEFCSQFFLFLQDLYVISLSNISIKTNFKQITRVELKFVQYSQGDYILCMTSHYFSRSFTNARLMCFVSHSNDMTSCQSSLAENVS
jgi:hypothetical protein